MTEAQHHHAALIETARSELERAHAAAVAMLAGDMRSSLQLALAALREAAGLPEGLPVPGTIGRLEQALAELDEGRLADMEQHVEQVRAEMNT